MDKAVGDAVKAEDADRIGADAEIDGVAEADEAAVPQDQIEAERGDRKDHHAGEQPDIKRRVGRRRNARHQRQRGEADERRDPSSANRHQRPGHRPLGGKRPCGRMNSTAAIRI